MTRTELDKRISDYLAAYRESGRSGAILTQDDLRLLDSIIEGLVELKCEPGPHGWSPVDILLVDRASYQRMHYEPVPYPHKASNPRKVFDALMANLRIATESLDSFLRGQDSRAGADDGYRVPFTLATKVDKSR